MNMRLFLLLLLINCTALASDPLFKDIRFMSEAQLFEDLTKKEIKELDSIFKHKHILDLESPGLSELKLWTEQLVSRLTISASKIGFQTPSYKVYYLVDDEAESFLYKYRPPDRNFFVGHVFINTGLIKKFFKSQQVLPQEASMEQVEFVLEAIQGTIAHNFASPKEDEIVKWQLRASQEISSDVSNGQLDVVASDILAHEILRDAKLNNSSLLHARELSIGGNPGVLNSIIGSTPDEAMTINLARGVLAYDRVKRGTYEVESISFHTNEMIKNLSILYHINELEKQLLVVLGKSSGTLNFSEVAKFMIQSLKNPSISNKELSAYVSLMSKAKVEDQVQAINKYKELLELITSENSSNVSNFKKDEPTLNYLTRKRFQDWESFPQSIKDFSKQWVLENIKPKELQDASSPKLTLNSSVFKKLDKFSSLFDENLLIKYRELYKVELSDYFNKVFVNGKFDYPQSQETYLRHCLNYLETLYRSKTNVNDEIEALETYQKGLFFEGADTTLNIDIFSFFLKNKDYQFINERYKRYAKDNPKKANYLFEMYTSIIMRELSTPFVYLSERFNDIEDFLKLLNIVNWHFSPEVFPRKISQLPKENLEKLEDFLRDNLLNQQMKSLVSDMIYKKEGARIKNVLQWKQHFFHEITAKHGKLIGQLIGSSSPLGRELKKDIIQELFFNENFELLKNDSEFIALEQFLFNQIGEYFDEKTKMKFMDIIYERKMAIWSHPRKIRDYVPQTNLNLLLKFYFKKIENDESFKKFFPEILKELKIKNEKGSQIFRLGSDGTIVNDLDYTTIPSQILNNVWEGLSRQNMNLQDKVRLILNMYNYDQFRYHSGYITFFKKIRYKLISDIEKEIGLQRELIHTNAYLEQFRAHKETLLSYLKSIFNPDDYVIPYRYNDNISYNGLDQIQFEVMKIIPVENLSPEEIIEIWNILSGKRVTSFTDRLLIEYINKIATDEKSGSIDTKKLSFQFIKDTLENERTASEKVRVLLAQEYFKSEIEQLSQVNNLTDAHLFKLFRKIERIIPRASVFLDNFLENEIAWKLHLSKEQNIKYILPLKSFNYKKIDLYTMNALSAISQLIKVLSNEQKIKLVAYIQNPNGELYSIFPKYDSSNLNNGLVNLYMKKIIDKSDKLLGVLESHINDASALQKLALIEAIVGSQPYGLFYQGEHITNKLYSLAGIESKNDIIRFQGYTQSLNKYEHSILLSFLLANNPISTQLNGEKSRLLQMAEAHGPIGIKGAQLADILALFGTNTDLAKAKNSSSPATMLEIYNYLERILPSEEYNHIDYLEKLSGSGGIKHVVICHWKDGSTDALYIKKEYLVESIKSTINILKSWTRYLQQHPDYNEKVNYTEYLLELEEQTLDEASFLRELKLSNTIAPYYEQTPSYKGWIIKPAKPSSGKKQREGLLIFQDIRDTVPFEKLADDDKKIVSEFIFKIEIELMFKKGIFDSDRHLGNFLFNPKTKEIHAIDFGQVYELKKSSFFSLGDINPFAQIIYHLTKGRSDKNAAVHLAKVFAHISKNKNEISEYTLNTLSLSFKKILDSNLENKELFQEILASITEHQLHLPRLYSMGIFKGFLYLTNEKYAQNLDKIFIEKTISKYVRRELIYKRTNDIFSVCNKLFK